MDEILSFATPAEFRKWLKANHRDADRIWLRFFKKGSGQKTITHAEALDQALCFGWIDGQLKPYDDASWLHRFSRRRARSGWSKVNTEHVGRLTAADLMQPAGLAEVTAAQQDGRWAAAYDSPKNATIPDDFMAALKQDSKALSFFESLNKANRYAIAYRLQTAKKPETRAKRMEMILAMLARGEAFH